MDFARDLSRICERRGWSGRPACIEPDAVRTHGAIHDTAARAASVLSRNGAGAGRHVLLMLPDSAAWVVAFLGCARLATVAVTVNPDLSRTEHGNIAADYDPVLVLAEDGLHDRFPDLPALTGKALLEESAAALAAPVVETAWHDPLYVQYTSGTTGRPKGVVHRCSDPGRYLAAVGRPVVGVQPSRCRSRRCTSPTDSATRSLSRCSPDPQRS